MSLTRSKGRCAFILPYLILFAYLTTHFHLLMSLTLTKAKFNPRNLGSYMYRYMAGFKRDTIRYDTTRCDTIWYVIQKQAPHISPPQIYPTSLVPPTTLLLLPARASPTARHSMSCRHVSQGRGLRGPFVSLRTTTSTRETQRKRLSPFETTGDGDTSQSERFSPLSTLQACWPGMCRRHTRHFCLAS